MGNSSSSDSSGSDSDSEDYVNLAYKEDHISDEDGEADKDGSNGCELAALFDPAQLRVAASKVKDDMPENVVIQNKVQLTHWLEERQQRNEETVTLSQFCDTLMNLHVGREECIDAFQQFDAEGDGTADVIGMIEAMRASSKMNSHGELNYVIRALQACSLTPGFIDVYSEDKLVSGKHGTRLLNFLIRNRASSNNLPFPVLNSFNNTIQMRLTTLDNYFKKMKDSANRQQEESLLGSGEEMKPITKCFSGVEVSTNKADMHRLTNGDTSTFWQSDGSARSHWIRLKVRNNVVIKQLSVNVASVDQSYMPEIITVSVGKNIHSLREIKDIRIPSHVTGDVVLLENGKMYYPVIQLNIKRCHSDGCDTRIHGIKALGFRLGKETGISVLDASAAWYLQILSSIATTAMPVLPTLRTSILSHTQNALKHMLPLSLCPGSPEKPNFMSPHVLKEVDLFLSDVAINPVDSNKNVSADGLLVLLSFNLARGHVAGILRALKLLQEHSDVQLKSAPVMKSLNGIRDNLWKKQGPQIQVSLAGYDGGEKDETSGPQNILLGNWASAKPYLSANSKTKCNFFFKGNGYVQVTKMRLKVDKSPRGAKRGMIFVYSEASPFVLDQHVTKFEKYDSWTYKDYDEYNQMRLTGGDTTPDGPVAYFTVDDEWDETEVPLDVCPVGQYVCVKLLEPRDPKADRIGVVGIKFHGFNRKPAFVDVVDLEKQAQLPVNHDEPVNSNVIFLRTLSFLVSLSRGQAPTKKAPVQGKIQNRLDMSDLTVGLIWKVYSGFENKYCKNLTLQLLHALFPYFTDGKEDPKESSDVLFTHLRTLVDEAEIQPAEKEEKSEADNKLVAVAKQVIIDGAAVFFPDKEARRNQLLSMMTDVNATKEMPSVSLTFQSLCQFFSSVDPSGLLDLPQTVGKEFNLHHVIGVMDTLLTVASLELKKVLETREVTEQSCHLVNLVCSLQTSLLSWCHRQLLTPKDKDAIYNIEGIMVDYINLLGDKSMASLSDFKKTCTQFEGKPDREESLKTLVTKLQSTFLATAYPQMVLTMNFLSKYITSSSRVKVLNKILPIVQQIQQLETLLPQCFHKVDSDAWKVLEQGYVVLRTWEVESPHNYENNQHSVQTFTCPGASTFAVEFDPKCETEKRYDFLEFTDCRGAKTKFDEKVGTKKWPQKATFEGGPKLQFLFHSDSSNNEWGYKFKVTATGYPDVPLSWIFDLHLSLAKLCGTLCGATLDNEQLMPKKQITGGSSDKQEDSELELLKSELWTTLFRGGYAVGKLQRSMSGKLVAEQESAVGNFLLEILEELQDGGLPAEFYERCLQQHSPNILKVGSSDSDSINVAVKSVFAALVWHTQALREDLEKFVKSNGQCKISDGIYQAFNTAESFRAYLIEHKQKKIIADEKEDGKKETRDNIALCADKAKFLLKFAGLAKIHIKSESKFKLSRQISRHNRYVGQDKNYRFDSATEKYPSFKLVLEFVRDTHWSTERVDQLLKTRAQQATAVADVYMFASEYIRLMGKDKENVFQVPNILFLQAMLKFQDKFPKHYADGLDGCGLDLESKVRRSYYSLIRRLIESLKAVKRNDFSKEMKPCLDFVQACTLHLLDINWQQYDLSFLVDIKLPDLYMNMAKGSVSTREKAVTETDEETELSDYKRDMKWLKECKKDFMDWFDKRPNGDKQLDETKKMQMFVARFCDLLEVEITCDGCNITIPGKRYRCLQCQDTDLCAHCYAGGVKPGGDHNDDHEMVELLYKCDECVGFIVGTRIHCEVCEDFDLCLGCHNEGHFPAGHSKEHSTLKIPMLELKLDKDVNSILQSYVHQHVWLLFASLSLSMANIIYSRTNVAPCDIDYQKSAVQIHNLCIELANKSLMQIAVEQDSVDATDTEAVAQRQDQAFAYHSQERIMGLLGAMIPPEEKLLGDMPDDCNHSFVSGEFLHLLFTIAKGDSGHETNTQHMAIGLIGQLLQRTSTTCKLADAALGRPIHGTDSSATYSLSSDSSAGLPNIEEGEGIEPEGQKTAKFLFSFGASCLERSGLEWANSMANILQHLFNSPAWRDVLFNTLTNQIHDLSSTVELSSIFALFVIAGFPEVLSVGSTVKYSEVNNEPRDGIVLKHFPDKNQTLVIDKRSRKRKTVKDEHVETISYDIQVLDQQHITAFVNIIKDIGAAVIKNKTEIAKTGVGVSVESMWVLSLTLKGLLRTIQGGIKDRVTDIYNQEFVQTVVHLAEMGTGFKQRWLLKDLEILSLMLYTRDQGKKDEKSPEKGAEKGAEGGKEASPKKATDNLISQTDKEKGEASAKTTPNKVVTGGAKGDVVNVEVDTGLNMKSLPNFQKSSGEDDPFVKREVSSGNNQPARFEVMETEEDYDDSEDDDFYDDFQSNSDSEDEFLHHLSDLARQGKIQGYMFEPEISIPIPKSEATTNARDDTETVTEKYTAVKTTEAEPEIPKLTKIGKWSIEKAVPEPMDDTSQRLITTSDRDRSSEVAKKKKSESTALLRKELETQGKSGSRDFLVKTNLAMSVLYARQVLTALLAEWPTTEHDITAQFIGCKENSQVPFILDLLNQVENKENFGKVVNNVIHHCARECLVPIATTACQFLEEVNMVSITKESEHNYKNNTEFTDKVHIPGSTSLLIRFDRRCATEENCDEVIMASSEDLKQDKHKFSGMSEKWIDFEIPGDTLYFKFTSDISSNDWGYKFTVMGGKMGRFDTGYLILNCVLSMEDASRLLPMDSLWDSLVYVACKQTGQERLKAIQLLLKIMQSQTKQNTDVLQIDLDQLKLLWDLYSNTEKTDSKSASVSGSILLRPASERALTELFLNAENLAIEWDIANEYLISMSDDKEILKLVYQGLENIAALSLAVGVKNKATEGFEALKDKS